MQSWLPSFLVVVIATQVVHLTGQQIVKNSGTTKRRKNRSEYHSPLNTITMAVLQHDHKILKVFTISWESLGKKIRFWSINNEIDLCISVNFQIGEHSLHWWQWRKLQLHVAIWSACTDSEKLRNTPSIKDIYPSIRAIPHTMANLSSYNLGEVDIEICVLTCCNLPHRQRDYICEIIRHISSRVLPRGICQWCSRTPHERKGCIPLTTSKEKFGSTFHLSNPFRENPDS